VLGLSVPHLNRMMQRLRAEKLITDRERMVEFLDAPAMQTLAHYQPQSLTPIPFATRGSGDKAPLGADGEVISDLTRDTR
jgi:hypothetical protein